MKRILRFFKTRKPDFWYRMLIIVCAIIFCLSLGKLIMIFYEYNTAESEYDDIQDDFVSYEPVDDTGAVTYEAITGTATEVAVQESTEKGFRFKKANIDFNSLKKINNDIVGWIQFETFALSYPIAQDTGNGYYLKHTFKKEANKAGCIYISENNSRDFNDTNTIIFGHNMKNGSMFGLLGRYKSKSFYQANQCFYLYTPEGERKYQIFSAYVGEINGEAFTIYGDTGNDAYRTFLSNIQKKSLYKTGVEVKDTDRILTLVTCSSGGVEKRMIIHAKRIQ